MTSPGRPPLTVLPRLRASGALGGFTGKAGGVSRGPLASLNLARRPGEEEPRLVENWRRVAAALRPGWGADRVALLDQVHRATVARIDRPGGPLATLAEADAALTTTPGVVLAVRVADCVPILLAAPGAVAAVHSGWRGTARAIVAAAVADLCEAAGCGPDRVVAAIGPHISGAAYEVGDEVADGLLAAGLTPARFLTRHPTGRLHVDLGAAVAEQLERAGVREVHRASACTATDPRYFSHRAEGPATGRQAG